MLIRNYKALNGITKNAITLYQDRIDMTQNDDNGSQLAYIRIRDNGYIDLYGAKSVNISHGAGYDLLINSMAVTTHTFKDIQGNNYNCLCFK